MVWSFFRQPDIGRILAFLLLYRFAEAQLLKLVTPFLLDAPAVGGLGLQTQDVGIAYGTVGVTATGGTLNVNETVTSGGAGTITLTATGATSWRSARSTRVGAAGSRSAWGGRVVLGGRGT